VVVHKNGLHLYIVGYTVGQNTREEKMLVVGMGREQQQIDLLKGLLPHPVLAVNGHYAHGNEQYKKARDQFFQGAPLLLITNPGVFPSSF
jgi:hypothetical protein